MKINELLALTVFTVILRSLTRQTRVIITSIVAIDKNCVTMQNTRLTTCITLTKGANNGITSHYLSTCRA